MNKFPVEKLQAVSAADLLFSPPVTLAGPEGIRFEVESPCGCTSVWVIKLESFNTDACVNASPTDPKDLN